MHRLHRLQMVALLVFAAAPLRAQLYIKCGADLVMRPALVSIGHNVTCIATFDVIRDTPTHLVVTLSDTTRAAAPLIQQTAENLQRLAFRHDTFGVRFVFEYVIDPDLSTHYWRTKGTDTIQIVTPQVALKALPCATESRRLELDKGTLTLEGNIFTADSAGGSAAISVERFFLTGEQETMMLENNYPQFDAEIRAAAELYDRDRFRNSVGELDEASFRKLRCIIRFHVVQMAAGSHRYIVR